MGQKRIGQQVMQQFVDSIGLVVGTAVSIIWNATRPPEERPVWALGEFLLGLLSAAYAQPGTAFQFTAMGVQAGAIGTIMAPVVVRREGI